MAARSTPSPPDETPDLTGLLRSAREASIADVATDLRQPELFPLVDPPRRLRELEALRQEARTFDIRARQREVWFWLSVAVVLAAVVVLVAVCVVAVILVLDGGADTTLRHIAAAALFVEVIAMTCAIWRFVVGEGPTEFGPVTLPPAPSA